MVRATGIGGGVSAMADESDGRSEGDGVRLDSRPGVDPRTGVRPDVRPDQVIPRRWGPASWWRFGLLALLALIVGIALAGGAFWTAVPADAPR